jgi:UDP:flavonoid glycosyltransferase YjiC (YdhE family)
MMFNVGRKMLNLMMKGYINKARRKFDLPPVKDIWEHWMGDNVILACDKEINAARDQLAYSYTQTGFMLLPSKMQLPAEVNEFLDSGDPPVYIGFGSNPITNAEKFSSLFERVHDMTNQRLIISKGWAEFSGNNTQGILYVDELPFELLFPRVSSAIYHGGTGTMAAIARAGIPQAAFPFMADQFDNRKQIVKMGLGPDTCGFKKLSDEALSVAIMECVTREKYKDNAKALARKLENVNGVELTIQCVEEIIGTKTSNKG